MKKVIITLLALGLIGASYYGYNQLNNHKGASEASSTTSLSTATNSTNAEDSSKSLDPTLGADDVGTLLNLDSQEGKYLKDAFLGKEIDFRSDEEKAKAAKLATKASQSGPLFDLDSELGKNLQKELKEELSNQAAAEAQYGSLTEKSPAQKAKEEAQAEAERKRAEAEAKARAELEERNKEAQVARAKETEEKMQQLINSKGPLKNIPIYDADVDGEEMLKLCKMWSVLAIANANLMTDQGYFRVSARSLELRGKAAKNWYSSYTRQKYNFDLLTAFYIKNRLNNKGLLTFQYLADVENGSYIMLRYKNEGKLQYIKQSQGNYYYSYGTVKDSLLLASARQLDPTNTNFIIPLTAFKDSKTCTLLVHKLEAPKQQ